MKLTKIKQKLLDEAYHTVIQVCLFDKPLEEMAPLLAEDVMNFGAGKKELTRTKAAFLKQIKNQKELASGLKMDFQFTPILRKVINGGNSAIYTDDIVNTVWVNNIKSELKFRLSFIFEYNDGQWLLIHSHTSTPDSQRTDDEIWPVEELKKRTAFLEKSLEEKVAELHDKNRELEIEAALERVRSKTMAMHNSADVGDTVVTLFDEVLKLGLDKTIRCGIGILEGNELMETWSASYSLSGKFELRMGQLNMTIHPMLANLKEAWKKKEKRYAYEFIGKDVIRYYRALNKEPGYPFNADLKTLPEKEFHNSFFFSSGILFAFTENPILEEAAAVLQRFTNVFGQTYRRYLDLQKAEAQAREGQIEAALERVRGSSMAMHKSEQLPETSQVLFEQFALLGNIPDRISIGIFKEEENIIELWATDQIGSQLNHGYSGPLNEATTISKTYKAWKEGKDSIVVDLTGQKLKDWVRYIKEEMRLPIDVSHIKGRRVQQAAFFSKGILLCTTNEPVADEIMQLLIRFAKVFDQAYTRFLDLQKAETQAKEARVEAALERVRAASMAMHKTSELAQVVMVLFQQFSELELDFYQVWINIFFIEEGYSNCWFSPVEGVIEEVYTAIVPLAPFEESSIKSWRAGEEFSYLSWRGLKEVDEISKSLSEMTGHESFIRIQKKKRMERMEIIDSNHKYGVLTMAKNSDITNNDRSILKRFSKVFEQTYTRFLDLKKAEIQAREAQIEAALEKVRGKAMAMHHSSDLEATASVVFSELKNLGINTFRSGVGLLNKENTEVELYGATSTEGGIGLSLVGKTNLKDHPVLSQIYSSWLNNEEYYPTLKGDLLKRYYEQIGSQYKVPSSHIESNKQYGHFLPFSEGVFYGWSYEPFTEAEITILKRFNAIIDLTFRRYIELQKAEANALDAVRRSSVDRVRAEIASMRTKADLDRITPLIWNELTTLGVPFVRCGVFIFDEKEEQIHTFLSKPDGKAIAAFHLPYDSSPFVGAIENWRSKKIQIIQWKNEEFSDLADTLVKKGQIASRQQYLGTVPKGGLSLHYVPFLQGILYVGNTKELTRDNLQLVQSVADAFSTAYARYEDFNKLELAKLQVEQTLTDLKQTQEQLVQSEKMASLGELTAGIAHEIQNPLNFVNNFSEVSSELIDEMNEELHKGDYEEAKALAADIKQNLEKINHHGKRADGIVKGMLQHSRTSSGQKEATDINVLADEYLRLAYHGLRAKDKTFNATLNSEFDENIGRIKVVPQDIGRVILNLITNAFYAVKEKSSFAKVSEDNYEPTVSVSTKKTGNQVLISVKDNGNGIPKKILEKIFQPFFTTKPTGQGTGLGLSLSYDIIHAHGGELKVNTKEGEGSEFTMILPVNHQS